MPPSDPGLRRVSVHAGGTAVDVALPAGIPVAALIPAIVDIVRNGEVEHRLTAGRYQLSLPGAAALDATATLAESGIRDGAVLMLAERSAPLPEPRHHDVAEAVSATLVEATHTHSRRAHRLAGGLAAGCLTGVGAAALVRSSVSGNVSSATVGIAAAAGLSAVLAAGVAHRAYGDAAAGLALSLLGTAFAAVAGFLAVPGPPGPPNGLLAAAAALATASTAMRVSGCGAVTLAAISGLALIIAATSLAGMITAAPLRVLGAVAALLSLAALGLAARASIALAGLSPQPPPAPDLDVRAARADTWCAGLLAAFASSAAAGAILTVLVGAPRLSCIAFGALTSAVLLLRARSATGRRAMAFAACALVVTATTFGVTAWRAPGQHAGWVAAATALLAAAAMVLGCGVPQLPLSPVLSRGVELLECLALVAMVPLGCWVCGLYGGVAGFGSA